MKGCWRLRLIPDIYGNITELSITDTMLEELVQTINLWSRLQNLVIWGSINPYTISEENLPERSGADIERIPDRIKDLPGLDLLFIFGCPKLASLPELPRSLTALVVHTCESLETITSFPIDSQIEYLSFTNCYKLGPEARRVITTQQPSLEKACLPGWEIPAEFHHRALGNSLTISSSFYRFRVCVVVTPELHTKSRSWEELFDVLCRITLNGFPIDEQEVASSFYIQGKHLCIFQLELLMVYGWLEQDNEVLFQFSISSRDVEIVECGVQILTDDDDDECRSAGSHESED